MAEPTITVEEVKKIAKLANMNVTGQEEKFAQLFTDTLRKIQDLNEIDTSKIAETFQVTGLTNVFQKETDSPNSLTKEEALSNAKETERGLFATKGVFYKEEDVS